MAEKKNSPIEEIQHRLKLLAQPVDFDELIAVGLLERKGAWYKVPNLNKLPEHARVKISDLKKDQNGLFVKFRPASKPKKIIR